ncbi:L-arabinose isomerase [Pelagicoccus sp. NFK12]|uniref:L-arabinose isomerase n=1 Tax=Pelagicoccus enzymogenes TaxID=2773457 RepID=A0A927F8Q2_9BACT|nr:L-arabinose isomerase [Pelagicoccus enzymogenes]MBD5780548.1 L-arabinose isomerase [Pelagicoccus enzymogenes]
MKSAFDTKEVWLVVGSQHLYGPETLKQVAADSQVVADSLDSDPNVPVKVVFKALVTTPDEILAVCREASAATQCVGVTLWMHTFSPSKMWIRGLKALTKPICHLHTQYARDLPWSTIDMDYMNLHQSAHGGREFGHICARLEKERAVIVGHWEDPAVRAKFARWTRVAGAWAASQELKVVRFGDNMRQVAVTCGDKVEAESVFGYSVNTHGIGDLVEVINGISDAEIDALCGQYADEYELASSLVEGGAMRASLRETAKIELGLRSFLETGGFGAFTDTFEDLHGMAQLPGLPVQRLMADGYGFGGEGDWKTSALVRTMKIMASGIDKGTSFMEDYTYHFNPAGNRCLGAHMLEICPSIADAKPSCEIHPLGIGGKADPVRLVFNGKSGPAINASVVDMGNRFRLLVNKVNAMPPEQDLPKLPVARVLWEVLPSLEDGAAAWIYAGGAHHTGFSYTVNAQDMEMFAAMAGIEYLLIDEDTKLREFKNEIRWNNAAYGIRGL